MRPPRALLPGRIGVLDVTNLFLHGSFLSFCGAHSAASRHSVSNPANLYDIPGFVKDGLPIGASAPPRPAFHSARILTLNMQGKNKVNLKGPTAGRAMMQNPSRRPALRQAHVMLVSV
jgi:hypothetical protein